MPFSKQEFLDNLNDPKKLFFSYAVKISSVNFTLLLEYFVEKADDVFFTANLKTEYHFYLLTA